MATLKFSNDIMVMIKNNVINNFEPEVQDILIDLSCEKVLALQLLLTDVNLSVDDLKLIACQSYEIITIFVAIKDLGFIEEYIEELKNGNEDYMIPMKAVKESFEIRKRIASYTDTIKKDIKDRKPKEQCEKKIIVSYADALNDAGMPISSVAAQIATNILLKEVDNTKIKINNYKVMKFNARKEFEVIISYTKC